MIYFIIDGESFDILLCCYTFDTIKKMNTMKKMYGICNYLKYKNI